MKLRPFGFFHVSLALVLACSGPVAQNDSSQRARTKVETEADAGREEDSQASRRRQLEQALDRLNGVLTESPSRLHHERAEILFRLGRFTEAVRDYDTAARFGRPHNEDSCWERGLAQYYAGDFRGGREQFSRYHRVGPTDIENGLWRFLCIAEEEGIAKARETTIEYPRKVRKPFPALLALYLDKGSVDAVLDEARRGTSSVEELTTNLFYAHYYLGKYYEIVDQKDRALTHVQEALKHKIPDFMYACAEADEKRLEGTEGDSP